jgi:hypothetical protein
MTPKEIEQSRATIANFESNAKYWEEQAKLVAADTV